MRQLSHWWVRPNSWNTLLRRLLWRPHPVRALAGIRIVHIDAGCLHSVALSQELHATRGFAPREDGALYAWGAPLQVAHLKGLIWSCESAGRHTNNDGHCPIRGPSVDVWWPLFQLLQVSWVPRLVAPSPKLPLVRIGAVAAGGAGPSKARCVARGWHSMTTAAPSSPWHGKRGGW